MKANVCFKNGYFDIVANHEGHSSKTTLSIINDTVQDIWVEKVYLGQGEIFKSYFSVSSNVFLRAKKS